MMNLSGSVYNLFIAAIAAEQSQIKDVFRLKLDAKLSYQQIADALGISKGVVTKYVGLVAAAGLDWTAVQGSDEAALERRLLGASQAARDYVHPDYGRLHQELRRKGMTLMLLWEEHRADHADGQTHAYSQFCDNYRRFARQLKRSMRQIHRAGEKLFIDYTGPTIALADGEIEDRLIPDYWEGDLIKSASSRSSVGTLVERITGFVVLAKMVNVTTKAVVDSFSLVLNREPAAMRKTMAYDQGREMHGHKILTEPSGVQINFADPHSPGNGATNGLLRQYMPRGGADLSICSQDELDAIALSLNTRPRARLGYESPLVVYTQHIALLQHPTGTVNLPSVALGS